MIRKNPNGTYTARLGTHGTQRTFPLKREAEEYERKCQETARRQRAGLDVEQGPITYGALCDLWEENYKPSDWRRAMLSYSKTAWGKTLVRAIQPEALGPWLHNLKGYKGGKLSGKTKSHVLETMRQVFNAGVEWGYLTRSPARPRAFKAPSQQRLRPINPFESWDDVLAVAKHLGTTGPIARFVCSTGLTSPSEWLNANWRDVDLKTKTMIVHGTKTKNRARTIPLSNNAIAALKELPRAIDGRVFTGKRGGKFDYHEWRKTDWPAALKAAGLSHRHPNEMRHTFATLALQAGVPIDDVADILGHGDVEITYRYYRKWTRKMADRARAVLDTIGAEESAEPEALADA